MSLNRPGAVLLFGLALLAGSCGGGGASPIATEVELPAGPVEPGGLCLFYGIEGIVRGAQDYPGVAWLEVPGRRFDILWPSGFRARFSPRLEILDRAGRVVVREGETVEWTACASADPNVVLLMPPLR